MRERWLLQGTPTGPEEEDEERRKQVEQDELQAKKIEDFIQRYMYRIFILIKYSIIRPFLQMRPKFLLSPVLQ